MWTLIIVVCSWERVIPTHARREGGRGVMNSQGVLSYLMIRICCSLKGLRFILFFIFFILVALPGAFNSVTIVILTRLKPEWEFSLQFEKRGGRPLTN